jgi:hypothetical protein
MSKSEIAALHNLVSAAYCRSGAVKVAGKGALSNETSLLRMPECRLQTSRV